MGSRKPWNIHQILFATLGFPDQEHGTYDIRFKGYSCLVSWSDWTSNIITKCVNSAETPSVPLSSGNVGSLSVCAFICLETNEPTFGRRHKSGIHQEFIYCVHSPNSERVARWRGAVWVVQAWSVVWFYQLMSELDFKCIYLHAFIFYLPEQVFQVANQMAGPRAKSAKGTVYQGRNWQIWEPPGV